MSTIILPFLLILLALGGIVALIGRRLYTARSRQKEEPHTETTEPVRSVSDITAVSHSDPEPTPEPLSFRSRIVKFRRKKITSVVSKEDASLGPVRTTLDRPHHSRVRSFFSGISNSVSFSGITKKLSGAFSAVRPGLGVVVSSVRSGAIIAGGVVLAKTYIAARVVSSLFRRVWSRFKKRDNDFETEDYAPIPVDLDLETEEPKQNDVNPEDTSHGKEVVSEPIVRKAIKPVEKKRPILPPPVVSEKKSKRRTLLRLSERKLPADEIRDRIPALIEEGKIKEAESILVGILSSNPRDIEAYRLLGTAYLKSESFDQAIEVFEEAIRRDPRHVGVHGPLGDCYVVKGEYSKALSAYQRAHEQDEENVEYLEGLLYLATRMDRVPLIQGITGKILAIDPSHEDAKKALKRINVQV